MKPIHYMDASEVRRLFNLDVATGYLTRKAAPPHHPQRLGERVGTQRNDGYLQVRVNRHPYLLHRLVWAFVHGKWPENEIDHIDLDKRNNRPENLREANRSQNCRNVRVRPNNKLGVKGIHIDKESGKYRAQISKDGRHIHLGRFSSLEDACAVYNAASQRIAGEYAYTSAPDDGDCA